MAEKWILVAPWGDPSGWRPVAYRIPKIWGKCRDLWGETQEYVCKEENTISSTAAIAKCIWSGRHVQGVDLKVVVIASETLTQQGDGCREDIASIKDSAGEYVKQYIGKFFQGEEDRVKVFIAPGIAFIQRQKTLEFRCSVENYATVVFSHLLKVLTDEEPTTLIIDITHGINYMPYIAAKAAERAFEAYVMDKILGKDEKDADSSYRILVVNSDPYIGGRGGTAELNINIVSCREIGRGEELLGSLLLEAKSILGGSRKLYRVKKGREFESLDKTIRQSLNAYNNMAGAWIEDAARILEILDRGLLLQAAYEALGMYQKGAHWVAGGSQCSVDALLLKVIEYIDRAAQVECSPHLRVERTLWIDSQVLSTAVKSHRVRERISGALRSLQQGVSSTTDTSFGPGDLEGLLRYIPSRAPHIIAERELNDIRCRATISAHLFGDCIVGRETLYRVLYDATEELYDKLGQRDRELLKKLKYRCSELGQRDIEAVKSALGEDLEKLRARVCGDIDPSALKECTVDERNFYAHAGFEKNITLIKIDRAGGNSYEIRLRYRPECINTVKGIVEKALETKS